MRISRNWLSDYVDFSELSADDFCSLITTRVAEVEEMITTASPLANAVCALVKKVTPHPVKAHLKIATVDIGGTEVQVVCGAPNCREGMLSAYVPCGAKVITPGAAAGEEQKYVLVEEREISGVRSSGTLVSEAELGLSGEHLGVIELTAQMLREADAAGAMSANELCPGAQLALFLGAPDTILEIDNKSLTHRPDLWSHFGFAREISAILQKPRKLDADRFADDDEQGARMLAALGSGKSDFSISIAPGCGCRRFAALELTNLKTVTSPLWMRRRLFAVGAGVRNLIVDLSNYVMHDIGQPNHTYDANKLHGFVVYVRLAREGEQFLGLDNETRTLAAEDIVIADQEGSVALGGVIGGGPSAVSESTSRLLLESANFDPVRIRATTKRHALRTDASNRFEKSASPYAVPLAVHRYTSLLSGIFPEARIKGSVTEAFVERPRPIFVPLRFDYIRTRLGSDNSNQQISGILSALGFAETQSNGAPAVKVPYYRATRDVSIEDDLVEEVGRIHGYENIPECAPKIESVAAMPRPVPDFENKVQDLLCGAGFSEVSNYSFMGGERARMLGYATEHAVELQNPIDAELNLVRTTLVPGMLQVLERNQRNFSSLLFFEIGRGYEAQPSARHEALTLRPKVNSPAAFERRLLCLGLSSGRDEGVLAGEVMPPLKQGADFFALLGAVRRIVRLVSANDVQASPVAAGGNGQETSEAAAFAQYKAWMHPFRAASLSLKDKVFGHIAEVHPGAFEDCAARAVVAELDLELLLEADDDALLFKTLPKYPDSFFEMSVVMPKRVHYQKLQELICGNVDEALLRRLEVLAVYEGPPLKEEEKSVSVKLFLGANDRTLSGDELRAVQDKLVSAVESSEFALRK